VAAAVVALVVPAWNEAANVGAVLSEVPPEAVRHVFVVCGGSTDGTDDIARAHGATVLSPTRRGYGAACWAGVEAARGAGADVVAFLDGDYSDPPGELPRVLAPILAGDAELVLGSRDRIGQASALPLHARLGNETVLAALRVLLGRRLADLPSCKAIRLDAIDRLDMREMTYGWTTELIVKSVRAGLRIQEVPVSYRPRLGGQSKVSGTLQGTLGAAWKLCSCALRYSGWTPPAVEGAAT
jgi:glycosyltransferase involved in cell wall biosynthesis